MRDKRRARKLDRMNVAPEQIPEQTSESPRFKRLGAAIVAQDVDQALAIVDEANDDDRRRILAQLALGQREALAKLLPVEKSAALFESLAEAQSVEILEVLPVPLAADIVEEMHTDAGSDLLRALDHKDTEAILAEIEDSAESEDLRTRANYPATSAGGLMNDRVISFDQNTTVTEVLADLAANAEEHNDADVQYLYVTTPAGSLAGVLNLRSLVLGRRSATIETLMRPHPLSVSALATVEELEDIFDEKAYLGLPVIDEKSNLVGLVTREAVEEALQEARKDDYLKSAGIVGGEELRSMPTLDRCRRRLSWLGPNILLNLMAASVIAANESTLASALALAMFLPMVSDMSGCSGNQAIAVSIRELTLGIIQPRDYLRVFRKEAVVGVLNGLILGLVLGLLATFWKDNGYLGLVVGTALFLNTIVSVLLGGVVPLVLKRFKADPALASAPILTTCTDMCGFFLVLTLAAQVIDKL